MKPEPPPGKGRVVVAHAESQQSTAAAIEAEAAAWLARRDRGLSDAERLAFEQWRDESSRHAVAWLRLQAAWGQADRLAALKAEPAKRRGRSSGRAGLKAWVVKARHAGATAQVAAGIAACVLLVGGGHFAKIQVWGSPLSTPVGGRMVEPLSDGSRVEINTDSRIRVSVNGLRRKVWIDRGEAYFDIAPDASLPFVIQAGERRITVVGTRFSVYRGDDDVTVRVTEGLVVVKASAEGEAVRAAPGDEVRVAGGALRRVHRGVGALQDEMSWRSGRLMFQNATLGEVAQQFNRYNTRKLRVADADVAAIRVGGAFTASNVAGFAGLLRDSYDLRADSRGDEIIISR